MSQGYDQYVKAQKRRLKRAQHAFKEDLISAGQLADIKRDVSVKVTQRLQSDLATPAAATTATTAPPASLHTTSTPNGTTHSVGSSDSTGGSKGSNRGHKRKGKKRRKTSHPLCHPGGALDAMWGRAAVATGTPSPRVPCEFCQQRFLSPQGLSGHIAAKHAKQAAEAHAREVRPLQRLWEAAQHQHGSREAAPTAAAAASGTARNNRRNTVQAIAASVQRSKQMDPSKHSTAPPSATATPTPVNRRGYGHTGERSQYSASEKLFFVELHERLMKTEKRWSYTKTEKKTGVGRATIWRWCNEVKDKIIDDVLKNPDRVRASASRKSSGMLKMEAALKEEFVAQRKSGFAVTGEWLCMHARTLLDKHGGREEAASFAASRGWLHGFLRRNDLVRRKATKTKPQTFEERWPRVASWLSSFRGMLSEPRGPHFGNMGRFPAYWRCNFDQVTKGWSAHPSLHTM